MFRSNDAVQDLKTVILDLKRELATTKEENQLLKVKLRKLQNEVNKRDRQIETLLDPRKSAFVKKVISEEGASMLMNLKNSNRKLEKALNEKELLIKRLQNDLQVKKLYATKLEGKKGNFVDSETKNLKSISLHTIGQTRQACGNRDRNNASRRSVSADRLQEFEKLNHNIQHIRYANNDVTVVGDSVTGKLKYSQCALLSCTGNGGSPVSDLERNELLCDTPHEEILRLQNHFMDMIAEVDQLKTAIATIQTKQDKTTDALQKRVNNLTPLAKAISSLKQRQPTRKAVTAKAKCSNTDKRREKQRSCVGEATSSTEKQAEELQGKESCLYSELDLLEGPEQTQNLEAVQRIAITQTNCSHEMTDEEERKKTFHSLVEKMMNVV